MTLPESKHNPPKVDGWKFHPFLLGFGLSSKGVCCDFSGRALSNLANLVLLVEFLVEATGGCCCGTHVLQTQIVC